MRCVLSLVVVLSVLGVAIAESRFDEYLWTKASWGEFKLQRPRDRWRVEDSPLIVQQTLPLRSRECQFISTNGPGEPIRNNEDTEEPDSEWLTALVDSVISGTAGFGGVCSSAVEGAWDSLLDDIYADTLPTTDRIRGILDDVCVEAVEGVVQRYTLNRETTPTGLTLWKLVPRGENSEGSYAEVEAVERACERFMQQRRNQFVRSLFKASRDYDAILKILLERQLEEARGLKGETRMLEENCEDIHPNCEDWADKGECVLNPIYMLKYCRISCGVCDGEPSFTKVGVFSLGNQAVQELEQKSDLTLKRLQEELCPTAAAIGRNPDPIQIVHVQPVLQGDEIKDISRALHIELKDKCILLNRGWWTYEICFFSTIRQLHYASDGETVLDSNLIGTFAQQHTVHLHPLLLQRERMEELGMLGERRPYIMQTYEEGDVCSDGGIPRGAAIRIMCSDGLKQAPLSPDSIGIALEEPDPCHYLIEVLVPLMCHYPEYAVYPADKKAT